MDLDTAYGLNALTQECERVKTAPSGQGNEELNRSAFRMGQLVGGRELDRQTAFDALLEAATYYGRRGFGESFKSITSGLDAGPSVPRSAPETTRPATYDWSQFAVTTTEVAPEDFTVDIPIQWGDFWAVDYVEKWLLPPLLADGAQTVLYSPPKVGKSLLALEMAAALATGRECLGVTTQPTKVMYVDHENRLYADVRERLLAMGYGPDADMTNLAFYSFPRMHKLDTSVGADQIMRMAEAHHAELVIIDTVSRTITGEENANDTWLQFYSHTGSRLKAKNIALLRLDHTGKDVERGQRGGSAKSGDVDLVWRMETVVAEQTYKLICEASRMQSDERELVIHRDTEPFLRHRVDANGWRGVRDAKLGNAGAVLKATGEVFTIRGAKDHLRAQGASFSNSMITKEWLSSIGCYTRSE